MKIKTFKILKSIIFLIGLLCVISFIAFYFIFGIPPHFVKADNYAKARGTIYIEKCYPVLDNINKTVNQIYKSNEEIEQYQELENKLGGDIFNFYDMLLERYRKEYYETVYKGVIVPELHCNSIEDELLELERMKY
ncbi:MAG: hypothetical protein ACPHLK_02610 [Gammaproteobacteria bacterium]|jgi:hypothetical protein